MDKAGLWKLFFATGLPEVYLAARAAQTERPRIPVQTAFRPARGPAQKA